MRSLFSSILAGGAKSPEYRVSDSWVPSFDEELKLAVASFLADDAFHRAFGEGRRLDEKALLWHFILLLLSRRFNLSRTMITVRKDGDIKALLAGSSDITPSLFSIIRSGYEQELMLSTIKSAKGDERRVLYLQKLRDFYASVEDEQMEARIKSYFQLIEAHRENHPATSVQFLITMIVVDPAESGRGHLKAMLEALVKKLQKKTLIEELLVTTYDNTKVSMYEHLGFVTMTEIEDTGVSAWVMKRPLTR